MAKYGKKNIIKIDPLAYNIAIIGESGIGKTTIAKQMCEKLVGEEGYIIANVGKEDGIDAIAGAIYEDIEDWDKFEEFCDDIIENKLTDYPNLQVITWDTIDELIRIAEPEAIRLYNSQNREKKGFTTAKTIKQAWGGFGEGEKYTINLIMDKLWELKKVGVKMFLLGHTKVRTKNDPITGEDYDMLTTNMSYSYFNAFKTKLHFLGVASIDREVIKEKTGRKNMITKKEEERGRVTGEVRKITFRDDNFSIDSKSRFENIVESIPLDSDALIKAIEDAIRAEANKEDSDKSFEQRVVEQKEVELEKTKSYVAQIQEKNEGEDLENMILNINKFIKEAKGSKEILSPIISMMKEMGYTKASQIKDINEAQQIVDLCK